MEDKLIKALNKGESTKDFIKRSIVHKPKPKTTKKTTEKKTTEKKTTKAKGRILSLFSRHKRRKNRRL